MPMLMDALSRPPRQPRAVDAGGAHPAKLAAEMRKLGFEVTEQVGKTGVVAVMKNGPGPVLMSAPTWTPCRSPSRPACRSRPRHATSPRGHRDRRHARLRPRHAHDDLGRRPARRLAAMKDQWSGTLVMVLQPGEETGQGAKAMLEDGLFTRFPKPDYALALHDAQSLPAGKIGYHARLCAGQRRQRRHHRARRRRPRRLARTRPSTRSSSRRGSSPAADPGQPRDRSARPGGRHRRQLPCRHQAQHHLRRGQAPADRAQLQAGNPPALLDGIARIARGEAIAAGDARGPDAGRHRPRSRIHARRPSTRGASRRRPRTCSRRISARSGCQARRRSWAARTSAASISPTSRSRA